MTKGSLFTYLAATALLQINTVLAQSSDLEQQALSYVQQQLEQTLPTGAEPAIEFRPHNSRPSDFSCSNPILFSSTRTLKSGSFTLKAQCDYPRRWSRYLQGQISVKHLAVVSSQPLSKGHPLTEQDLKLVAIDERQLRQGFYSSTSELLGQTLKRPLASGKPLTPGLLSAPILVNKDDEVIIEAGNAQFKIEVSGTALEAGRLDQQISVMNNRSGRTIKARVSAKGRVKINR